MAATDLVAWAKLIGFAEHPDLARCEIGTFRYRVLHVAARITRGARQIQLRIDPTWRWATAIATHGNDSGPPSPDTRPTAHPTREPLRPWKARPPSDTGRAVMPTCKIKPTGRPAPAHPSHQGRAKNRG